jgi:hypothetical protein
MTSTIKVDNIQDQDGNNIINENANTITIGASGDTVTLASGASQSGFGRTGTVDWDTTKKTASFTATSGDGFFVDTTSSALTVTLPASPSAGDIVAIADYAGTAETNNITIARNGSNIEGLAENGLMNVNRESKTLIYVDATQGWVAVNDNADAVLNPLFVTATGGTITTSGNFKIHTFTGPGTFTVSCAGNPVGSNTVDYLVVAGGGGGGGSRNPGGGAGAGGAGGYRESPGTASGSYTVSPRGAAPAVALPVSVQGYPITVGGGGTGAASSGPSGANGSNSIFSTITSTGGGSGGSPVSPQKSGNPGGSGGGGPWQCRPSNVGSGNTPPVNPAQGTDGGTGSGSPGYAGGGGGGALSAGGTAPTSAGGTGGGGATSCITGSPVARAGGGGGGGTGPGGSGGSASAGAGAGGTGPNGSGSAAAANKGGGGGGGSGAECSSGGAGGSGVVIIRYKFQ